MNEQPGQQQQQMHESKQQPDTLPDAGSTSEASASAPSHGCAHYRRRCRVLCPHCDEWFACRFCHDAVKENLDKSLAHKMDRHLVCSSRCTAPHRTTATPLPHHYHTTATPLPHHCHTTATLLRTALHCSAPLPRRSAPCSAPRSAPDQEGAVLGVRDGAATGRQVHGVRPRAGRVLLCGLQPVRRRREQAAVPLRRLRHMQSGRPRELLPLRHVRR